MAEELSGNLMKGGERINARGGAWCRMRACAESAREVECEIPDGCCNVRWVGNAIAIPRAEADLAALEFNESGKASPDAD
jgi:hypothetical protein